MARTGYINGKYYSISPYVYCLNNPIKYLDPDGKGVWLFATFLPTTDGKSESPVPWATHTFIVVKGENEAVKDENYFAYGGTYGMVGRLKEQEFSQDEQVYNDFFFK